MRGSVIVTMMVAFTGSGHAQQRAASLDRPDMTAHLGSRGMMPPREIESAIERPSERDFRIEPSSYADRSAHTRALDEMNAINNRRPRTFRFKPVMALTFDAADLDGPARMTGIAPTLIGLKPRRR